MRCDKPTRERLHAAGIGGYGLAVDNWALGVLAYECVVGSVPFGEEGERHEMYSRILVWAVQCKLDDDPALKAHPVFKVFYTNMDK